MGAVANTIAERAQYQTHQRALLADMGIELPDEAPCRECGCTDSLACPQGCGWAQPDFCTVCADELEQLADPVGEPAPTRSTS
jgi:hypothetical protein